VGWKNWTWLSFRSIVTHPLLDSFTTYGTQLFYPFSKYPVAFNTIFVIDPLYTVPFLICVITVMFLRRTSSRRRIINRVGIGLSTAYLSLTSDFLMNRKHQK
jgi:inner membrane protein